jgi:hypothetical protein
MERDKLLKCPNEWQIENLKMCSLTRTGVMNYTKVGWDTTGCIEMGTI